MQNVRIVRIDYWIDKADKVETGIHFKDRVLLIDNQIRRARCWFPCIDDNSQRCWYVSFSTPMYVCFTTCLHFECTNIYHL